MTGNEILQSDLLDILFDKRNKQYGAYTLRKNYPNRLILSLCIALSSVFFLFFLFGANQSDSISVRPNDSVVLQQYFIPEPVKEMEIKKPPLATASRASAAPQVKLTSRIDIVDRENISKAMPLNNGLDTSVIGDQNIRGVPGGPKLPAFVTTSGHGGGGQVDLKSSEAPLINRGPEFPGGIKAWLNFLSRNLRVPDALEAGEKKTVLIRFEVAVDGSVTGFQVMQSAGKNYDEEVIRVLKRMPKWSPAMQSSQPVATIFTQPVIFVGVEE